MKCILFTLPFDIYSLITAFENIQPSYTKMYNLSTRLEITGLLTTLEKSMYNLENVYFLNNIEYTQVFLNP